jgi:hypothetical protein
MEHPDPKLHRNISFAKSALRIVAGLSFLAGSIVGGGLFLIAAELLGIAEELV